MSDRIKVDMEFFIKSSPNILFNYISTASGLSEWFADTVNVRGTKHMIFTWINEGEREAEILRIIPKRSIKFRWTDEEDVTEYWELEIRQDDLTNDVVLYVTDFCYSDELFDMKELWTSQIDFLKASIGA